MDGTVSAYPGEENWGLPLHPAMKWEVPVPVLPRAIRLMRWNLYQSTDATYAQIDELR
jgi:hypothetical protein